MFSIGEFSRITNLSIKALRLYHEKTILKPDFIDLETGYRYYTIDSIEKARVISKLKQLQFSLDDIKNILSEYDDDGDILKFMSEQKNKIEQKYLQLKNISDAIDNIIMVEREIKMNFTSSQFDVEEKDVDDILVAGVRYLGKYEDCGRYFSKIAKKYGRFICGKPINVYYDKEYKETDADIESCFPIRKGSNKDDIVVRKLTGGKVISLIHKGRYDELSASYSKIMDYVKQKSYQSTGTIREQYIKGPGMIFKGNPKNYLTEIQIPVS
jgi:effector-binding domain-containing protein